MRTSRIACAVTLSLATLAGSFAARAASIVSQYTFNESGSVAHDSSGVGSPADGSLQGGSTMSGDGYLSLDGISGYVNFGRPAKMTGISGGYTIEAWVLNVDTPVPGHEALLFGQDTSAVGVTMYRNVFYGYADGGGNNTAAAYFNPTNEMLVTVTYDLASNVIKIYRNGIFSNSTPLSLLSFGASSSIDFVTGTDLTKSQWLSGKVDEIRYYSGALSDSEVAANYTAGPVVPEPASLAFLALGGLLLRRR